MEIIADLEVHSKYARAVSSMMTPPIIAEWADKKGIDLVGTGDFTHPMWLRELEASLEEVGDGIYRIKSQITSHQSRVSFLLTSEVSCIYTHEGKGRRVHLLVYFPTFNDVHAFNKKLVARGANLFSDGRPIIGLTLKQVAEIALSVNKKALIIPAHVWTPWFGFYGHMSGYDSLHEAFGNLEKYIPAMETGLSSDPAMNWRIEELENKRIVSFGDAHSPQKLGREATVFEVEELTYDAIGRALWGRGPEKISYTIEFYPEEGKYHYSGHRKCNVVYSPNEARKQGLTCPVCGRALTMGVMSRVEQLASQEIETTSEIDKNGVRWIKTTRRVGDSLSRRPYVMLVPLLEIIAESLSTSVTSQKADVLYEHMIEKFGDEFSVLLKTPYKDLKVVGERIADAILKVRKGDIVIEPGYDGVFGKVKIWRDDEDKSKPIDQGALF
ncbi:hypothetical protein A2714_05715 [Candidatus Woesebacteria bacterium RIFCSPHIGHO2_01_FULL_38_9]|uniref:DNA helicase UvrD n=2 Tax=Candidatus Woeseibacteriota TaxID=1752722 RepID=A0A1F7Y047_9BACT|nr:MAG: hypothetical protein A2714_05715 [Candidatus Woesebacteria bacterium RIFCSPHIGHO2_01_FULL_38_9]OGM59070.1 MAG: hypothetical protein A3A75_05390 [Candidatus Woesebacteria bacterium RIFCSPLOWO2_01_FULL_39_10]